MAVVLCSFGNNISFIYSHSIMSLIQAIPHHILLTWAFLDADTSQRLTSYWGHLERHQLTGTHCEQSTLFLDVTICIEIFSIINNDKCGQNVIESVLYQVLITTLLSRKTFIKVCPSSMPWKIVKLNSLSWLNSQISPISFIHTLCI